MASSYRTPFVMNVQRQKLWGLLHAVIFVIIGSGIGAYLLSFLANLNPDVSQIMQVIGLSLVFIAGLVMLFKELPHPFKFLRYLLDGLHAWVSRGVISLFLFLIFGSIIFAGGGKSVLESPPGFVFIVITFLIGIFAMMYAGLVLSSSSIPFWRTPLIPVQFLLGNFAGGLAILFLVHFFIAASEGISKGIIMGAVLLLAVNLILMWGHPLSVPPVLRSETIRLLIKGELSKIFIWLATVTGIMVPIILLIIGFLMTPSLSSYLLAIAAFCIIIGLIVHRHIVSRAGFSALWR